MRSQTPQPVTVSLTGIRASSPIKLADQVRKGLPFKTLELFGERSGLSVSGVAALIDLPHRTLVRRRGEGRLTANESDRLVRLARVFGLAVDLFEGDVDRAKAWFERPQRALGNATPASAVRTDVGAREVERVIGRLEHGVVT
jgi:putative toxin-antitoxin system antitoxin component (TIGR02293 family)